MPTATELLIRARRGLEQPVDPAGLAVFRILFGLTMALATLRFALNGWIFELLVAPPYHFTYLGFDWVRPLSHGAMLGVFAVMGLAALSLSFGFLTRVSAAVFGALFTYAELIDKATYLNHYYFASLVALLLAVLPSGAAWSVDAWLRRRRASATSPAVPALAYALLRVQVGVVYVYAGLAKLDADWLFRAEPLRTWLRARVESPLFTGLASEPWVPYAMSWGGAAFDLAVVPLLLFRKTRPFAFAVAVCFHLTIWALFPIGVFSFVMLAAVTIFFAPDWPRRFVARAVRVTPFAPPGALVKPRSRALALAGVYAAVQLLVPLRFALYPGPVNWTEEGFRFAWRVMLIEKAGHVEFDVTSAAPKAKFHVFPRHELTPLQLRQMATQPDMIADYARHLRERYEALGHEDVRVFADAWVSFNGRRSQRFVDPTVDLASAPRSFAPKRWILPLETRRERALAAQR
jgi:hypothetical protein